MELAHDLQRIVEELRSASERLTDLEALTLDPVSQRRIQMIGEHLTFASRIAQRLTNEAAREIQAA